MIHQNISMGLKQVSIVCAIHIYCKWSSILLISVWWRGEGVVCESCEICDENRH